MSRATKEFIAELKKRYPSESYRFWTLKLKPHDVVFDEQDHGVSYANPTGRAIEIVVIKPKQENDNG